MSASPCSDLEEIGGCTSLYPLFRIRAAGQPTVQVVPRNIPATVDIPCLHFTRSNSLLNERLTLWRKALNNTQQLLVFAFRKHRPSLVCRLDIVWDIDSTAAAFCDGSVNFRPCPE